MKNETKERNFCKLVTTIVSAGKLFHKMLTLVLNKVLPNFTVTPWFVQTVIMAMYRCG